MNLCLTIAMRVIFVHFALFAYYENDYNYLLLTFCFTIGNNFIFYLDKYAYELEYYMYYNYFNV